MKNNHKYGYIAAICFIIALVPIDSPLWVISYIALAVMGFCAVRGKLWNWTE